MTGDLAVWLRAQLDADEQIARLALDVTERYAPDEAVITEWAWVRFTAPATHPGNRSSMFFDGARDPAFTLADITAKKKLLAMYAAHDHSADADHRWSGFAGGYATATDQMIEALAQPYAGRPGWHNEWNI